MYYVELDVANLANYFNLNSTAINHTTGFSVYFSDRRGEQTDPNPPASVGGTNTLTGGYGYEDFINSSSASGCPNGTLDSGEDMESDDSSGISQSPGVLRTYGNTLKTTPPGLWPLNVNSTFPTYTQLGTVSALENSILKNYPNCSGPGLAWPFALMNNNAGQELRMNPPIFFRQALKLVDASSISTNTACNGVSCGLTIVSENPVYIQGDWNNNPNSDATLNTPSTDTHVATSVVADAVTLLSNKWNDVNSFANPFDFSSPDMRAASPTTYRLAIVGGKGLGFQQPSGQETDMGTDGGVHNFLRYLENWDNITSYYVGSLVSVYYSHQAYGIFKCCAGGIYNPPNRNYDFDTDFLTPSLLPPLTPMLRALNTLTFTQDMLPTQ